jgi:hypothetical protein
VDEVLPAAPIRQWVLSVPFPLRFLFASNPAAMGEALRIVYRAISGFMIRKAGLTRGRAQCGAVTLIQRFGSALNLNVHFHMLIPDGVYLTDTYPPYFRRVRPPNREELQTLVSRIGERIGRHLERKGLLVRDAEHSHLAFEPTGEDNALADLQGHSITYRIALGPHRGRKAFRLQSLAPSSAPDSPDRVAQACRRAHPLHTEDALSGWHDARDVRALGFPGPSGRLGAEPRGEPDSLSRSLRAQSSAQGSDRTQQARARRTWHSRAGQFDPQARLDELGAAPETGVWYRDSALR